MTWRSGLTPEAELWANLDYTDVFFSNSEVVKRRNPKGDGRKGTGQKMS